MTYLSFKTLWSRRLIRDAISKDLNTLASKYPSEELAKILHLESIDQTLFGPYDLPEKPDKTISPLRDRSKYPPLSVCIVGAGIAGLYIAILLDSLEIPNLSYEILEASDDLGGRLRTYHFSNAQYDYFDVGAMRYPDIPIMRRVFSLFRLTGVPLIKYHLDGVNCPRLYNEILDDCTQPEQPDIFKLGVSYGGVVPDSLIAKGANQVIAEAFEPYRTQLASDFQNGFKSLMKLDHLSTREFLREKMKFDYHTIQWLETMISATSIFDQSFTEAVMDSLDFDFPHDPVEWSCIEGGSSLLVKAMANLIKNKPETRKRVTKIAINRKVAREDNMEIKVHGETKFRQYATVFNTTTLASLQRMDLGGAELHPAQKDAIRSLHYDSSAKVAIRFDHPWWLSKCGISSGGTAVTDLALRVCIYPSYGLFADPSQPAVLLCSYTWAQDAVRMGSLIRENSPVGEEELIELILRDIARMHAHQITYDEIKKSYTDHYAYEWGHDPHASGAFALFGPGQFATLYPYLTRPTADSKLHIVGEAASAHHAWVIGSLESAYRAVHGFLERYKLYEYMDRLQEKWGTVGELDEGRFGTAHLQVALGRQAQK